jgi:PiT family inorganic phosphate transporter
MKPLTLLLTTLFLSYINGANDNFKGVATLWGSGTTTYKGALKLATVTTLLGSLGALFISTSLISVFSGKGLVPDAIVNDPNFLISVAAGAGFTVWIATLIGFPISTTHSLTGALVGAGFSAVGYQINLHHLEHSFLLPLLISPILSIMLTFVLYPGFKFAREKWGMERKICFCTGNAGEPHPVSQEGAALLKISSSTLTIGGEIECEEAHEHRILSVDAQKLLTRSHYLSAGLVSFSRGLNDTPKIVALILGLNLLTPGWGIILVALIMALGAILSAKKVAGVMSRGITTMDHTQGFSANIVTALLVVFASRYGVPVSTTHVSCGALFGIGLANREGKVRVMGEIVLAWLVTLPVSALAASAFFLIITSG